MKVLAILILAAAGIAGYFYFRGEDAASPYYENCTAFLESALKSPGSLILISAHETEWRGDVKKVSLTYDAQNSFGALLRGRFSCSYLPNVRWWEESVSPSNDLRNPENTVDAYFLTPFEISDDGKKIGGIRSKKDDDIAILQLNALSVLGRRERGR